MTRSFLATTTTIAALIAAPMALASQDSMTDVTGNSPAITEGGDTNVVGSTASNSENTKRYGIGDSAYDPTRMAMSEAEYNALGRSIGAEFKTQDGVVLGMVEDVMVDAQGNPELVVDLNNDTKIDADTLVVTLLPDSIMLSEGRIIIDTTEDELYNKAQAGSKRDDETRTTVIVM